MLVGFKLIRVEVSRQNPTQEITSLPNVAVVCLKNSRCENLHACGIASKRVTNGGAYLRGTAPGHGQHSFEETPLRCRAVGDTVSDLTGPRVKPQTLPYRKRRL